MQLETYLKNHDKTHESFSKEIGVSSVSVYRYATGQRIPEPETMDKIRIVTGGAVTANDFYHPSLSTKPKSAPRAGGTV